MTREAKAARAREIMDIAEKMFLTTDYQLLKMSDIAKAAGISNGLLFVYFKTKETLFLCLLWREYEKRLDYLEEQIQKVHLKDFSDIQQLLLTELEYLLDENPVYIKLESIRTIILEKNADTEVLYQMKKQLADRTAKWSRQLSEKRILSQKEILDIFFTETGIITGCYLQNTIPDDVRNVILKVGFQGFQRDFRSDVLNGMKYYLAGYKQSIAYKENKKKEE